MEESAVKWIRPDRIKHAWVLQQGEELPFSDNASYDVVARYLRDQSPGCIVKPDRTTDWD